MSKVQALKGRVLVSDLEQGQRMVRGIIIPDDNGKSEGIRPRWGKVYSKGDDVVDVEVGQWILIEHGRWTRALKTTDENGQDLVLWGVEWPNSVLLVADERPETEIHSKHV